MRRRPGTGGLATAAAAALLLCAACPKNPDAETAQEVGDLVGLAIDSSYPQQAHYWVYICPDFYTAGCSAAAFKVGNQCVSAGQPQAGSCYDTGALVSPSTTYSISGCGSGCGTCGNSGSFTTPALFVDSNYSDARYFYCKTTCSAPAVCP